MSQPLVAIHCIAYNQDKYIRETLEGFVMQKTNFPFVAIVHDDASTDNTAVIIREYAQKYPNIINPIYETENQYSKPGNPLGKIMMQAIEKTGAKYVAYCEGDDYWTDPLKLQKQADFLENNPDYSLVCCNADNYIQTEKRLIKCQFIKKGTFDINYLIIQNNIVTCSTMLRKNLLNLYYKETTLHSSGLYFGDYQLWLYMSTLGKCMYLSDIMCVYRICPSGVSKMKHDAQRIKWMHSRLSVLDYYTNKYNVDDDAKVKAYFNFYRHWAFFAAYHRDKKVYERAKKFYSENRYFQTVTFFKFVKTFRYPKQLWTFIDRHNRISYHTAKSFEPK